jgi:hypothetical protein
VERICQPHWCSPQSSGSNPQGRNSQRPPGILPRRRARSPAGRGIMLLGRTLAANFDLIIDGPSTADLLKCVEIVRPDRHKFPQPNFAQNDDL